MISTFSSFPSDGVLFPALFGPSSACFLVPSLRLYIRAMSKGNAKAGRRSQQQRVPEKHYDTDQYD